MYMNKEEEILHLKDENTELRKQIKKMNDNMNDMWREIINLKRKRNQENKK